MTPVGRLLPFLILMSFAVTRADAQSPAPRDTYVRRNTFSVVSEYSNSSSHILLGIAPHRKFAALGFQYQRLLLHRHSIAWSYTAELRPLIFESDPTVSSSGLITGDTSSPSLNGPHSSGPNVALRCSPGTFTYTAPGPDPIVNTVTLTCGRQWNYAQGLSPIGTRLNFRTHHRLQPTLGGFGGYMFSTHPIPLVDAGSFNFTFEFAAGLELFSSAHRSVRLEYSVQHFSNHYTANENPGVDNGLFKLTYAFGR